MAFFLLLLCAGLGGLAYVELTVPAADTLAASSPAPAPARPALPKNEAVAFSLPPIETYAEVTERPLFSPTRQPPPAEVAQENIGNAASFVLLGVVITNGERTAIIQHGRPAVTARLAEGQALEGWTIQSISPNAVTLQNAGTQHALKLKDLKDRPNSAPASAPRPPRN